MSAKLIGNATIYLKLEIEKQGQVIGASHTYIVFIHMWSTELIIYILPLRANCVINL